MSLQSLIKIRVVCQAIGEGITSAYEDIKLGLLTPPIKVGRSSLWPESEIIQIQAAIIAGRGEEERKQLVLELIAARTSSAQNTGRTGTAAKVPAQSSESAPVKRCTALAAPTDATAVRSSGAA